MTTKKSLVKTMFMSILTAGIFGFVFTSCNDDELIDNSSASSEAEAASSSGEILSPIALNYYDYITSNDVEILNADTTKISVSKALADKLGITSFVDHPTGIYQDRDLRPFHRRAVKEQLVGDRYILDVVPSGLGEFLIGKQVALSTQFYINESVAQTRGSGVDNTARYTDAEGYIHPTGVHIIHRSEAPECITRSNADLDGYSSEYFSAEELLAGGGAATRGISSGDLFKIDEKGTFINMKGEFKADKKLGDGGDTLNIHVKAPYEVKLGYKFFLDVDREYFVVPVLNKFDAGVDGKFMIKPEVLIGYDKKLKFVDQKITLYTFDAYSFSFNICGVEFWVDVCPNIYMKFNANVSGAFYGGFQYHYERTFQAGVTYHNKWNAYGDTKLVADKLTFITPRTKFEAEASCGLFLGADLVVDKVAGPSIAVGPKVSANAKLEYAPFDTKQPITFNASLKAGVYAEMGAKLKLWKFDIAEWKSKPINLVPEKVFWSYEYPKSAEENNSDNNQVNKQMNELKQEWEKQNPELARKNAALSELQKAIDNWKKVKPTVSNYDLGSINIVKGTIVNSIYNYKDLEGYKNQDANMFNLITEMVAYEQILKNNGKLPPLDDVLGGIRKWYKSIQ
jgi:hypothetical protein